MIAKTPDAPITFVSGGPELLDRVEALWVLLRQHHADLSPLWRGDLLRADFAARRSGLLAKFSRGFRATLAKSGNREVGYCISTISADGVGEVDSIFVVSGYRGRGIGDALVVDAMKWLHAQNVSSIVVEVLHGNDSAVRLYARHGFAPRALRMMTQRPSEGNQEPRTQ